MKSLMKPLGRLPSAITGLCLLALAAAALTQLGTGTAWAAQGPAFVAGSEGITMDSPARTTERVRETADTNDRTSEETVVAVEEWDDTAVRVVRRPRGRRPNTLPGETILTRTPVRVNLRIVAFFWVISGFA